MFILNTAFDMRGPSIIDSGRSNSLHKQNECLKDAGLLNVTNLGKFIEFGRVHTNDTNFMETNLNKIRQIAAAVLLELIYHKNQQGQERILTAITRSKC